MQSEIVQDSGLSTVDSLPLPVERLGPVDVAGVEEGVPRLDDLAQRAGTDVGDGQLRARKERHFAGTAYEGIGMQLHHRHDRIGGGPIDPERLLGEQALARPDHVGVDPLVQVVAHGDVDDVHDIVGEHVVIVGHRRGDGVDLAEPVQGGRVDVADGGQARADRMIDEGRPALNGGRDLTAHQPATHDGHVDRPRGHFGPPPLTNASASSTGAS
jgi:hypothetical protein